MPDLLAKFISQFNPRRVDAIRSVLKFALELIPGESARYGRLDFNADPYVFEEKQCFPEEPFETGHLQGAICHAEFVVGGHSSVIIPDITDSSYADAVSDRSKLMLKSYVGCPIRLQSKVVGSISICSKSPSRFKTRHGDILAALARLIQFVIELEQVQLEVDEKTAFEKKLMESKALIEQMLHLSPVAIYCLDLVQQKFIKVNDYMCRATGYTEEEFLAMNPADLLTPKSREIFLWRCRAMASGLPVSKDVELEVLTKNGAVEWTRFHIQHLFENGQLTGANVVAHFITKEKEAGEELALYRRQLEGLVEDRTKELAQINQQLREEIEQRAVATEELRASSDRLKEMNTAMRVLLDKRKEDQQRAEELIRLNLKELIDPYLDRLGHSGLQESQKQLLDVIRMNLEEVVGSSMPEFSSKCYLFSPNELHVVNLIRKGKTTKEMAGLLNLSARTIESYRNSIRSKLGLKNKKINLKTYLTSI